RRVGSHGGARDHSNLAGGAVNSAASAPRGEGGFTLIELMVGLVVSSILIAFLLGSSFRMAGAFRVQRQVTDVQQTVRAAVDLMSVDIRQAGYLVPNGFLTAKYGTPTVPVVPIQIVN